MFKKLSIAAALLLSLSAATLAQNTNNSPATAPTTPTRRPVARRPAPLPTPSPATAETPDATPVTEAGPAATTTRTRRAGGTTQTPASAATTSNDPATRAVRATFETLLSGIRKSDVEMVMSVYWNSPQLVIFNNNGTVTRTWEQVRSNRASSYPDAKNVQLDVRDVRVQMTGRDGAVVTCLWTQSQEFRGTPESATGRLTVVFRLINNGWKIIHTHTSPAAPDPSRLLPSERDASSDDAATKPPTQTRP